MTGSAVSGRDLTDAAYDIANRYLSEVNDGGRSLRRAKRVAAAAARQARMGGVDVYRLMAAGFVVGIGRSPLIAAATGDIHRDAAAAISGTPLQDLAGLIAWHAWAPFEAELTGHTIAAPRPTCAEQRCLWLADMTIGVDGAPCTITTRLLTLHLTTPEGPTKTAIASLIQQRGT